MSLLKTLNLTACLYKSVLLCPNVYENELSRLAQPIKSTKFFVSLEHSDGLLFSDGRLRDRAWLLGNCGYNPRCHFVEIRTWGCGGRWDWSFRSGCLEKEQEDTLAQGSTWGYYGTLNKHNLHNMITCGKKHWLPQNKHAYEISEGIRVGKNYSSLLWQNKPD